ncbi:hypothetical protein BDZ94DRAFT_1238757 [Collybia nuda]|uniref:Uncharacterized protein n=1 Tax=Collybia nuda TaxID=64659 RepID=A0A9P5XYP2_9AGAR|nr:hypothetical protein BDZ94DRAFT_1238757 [Collybia nuda]
MSRYPFGAALPVETKEDLASTKTTQRETSHPGYAISLLMHRANYFSWHSPILKILYIKALPYNYTLVEQTPLLAELRVDDELPLAVMEWISNGRFWPLLKYIGCNVSPWLMDRLLDMFEVRAKGEVTGIAKRITHGLVRGQYFKVSHEQWRRVRSLQDLGVGTTVEEIAAP